MSKEKIDVPSTLFRDSVRGSVRTYMRMAYHERENMLDHYIESLGDAVIHLVKVEMDKEYAKRVAEVDKRIANLKRYREIF